MEYATEKVELAFLVPLGVQFDDNDGRLAISAADGTDQRVLGDTLASPGFAWSPDGRYIVGRIIVHGPRAHVRLIRPGDGRVAHLRFPDVADGESYYQFDWR